MLFIFFHYMKVWILIFIKVNVQSYFIYSPTRSYISIGHHQLVIGLESIDFSDQIKLWFVLFKQFENNIFLQTITSLEVNWKVSKWGFIREAVGFPLYFSFSGWWVVVVVVVVVVQAVLSLSPGEHNTLPPLILTRPAGRSLAGRWGQWPSYWSTCNSRYSIDIVFSPNLINHHHHHHHHYHPTDSPELQPFLGFPAEIIFSSHYEELEGN